LTNKVKRVISLLNKSKCPLILAGNGVRLSEAQELLSNFIEVNQIPVLLTWKAIDFFDSAHTLNFGSPGIMGSRFANFIVQNCDLLLILGSRLDPSITAFNSREFGKNATRVMVDIDRREISKIPNLDLGVVADMGEFLTTLQNNQRLINLKPRLEWLSYCKGLKEKYPVVLKDYSDSKDNINLYYFIDTLFKELSSDDVITPESSGSAGEVTYQAINVKKGQKIRNAAGLGSMGFGLPYAIGACIATGIKRTILINGDGAFQLNIQELEVVARLKLPIKMFILENNGYGSIMATQRNIFNGFYVGAHPESGLTLPNLSKIANTYGITYVEATNHNDLTPAIKRSLQADGPVLCAVKAKNHITSPRVQSLKLSNGGMISKPLEDMWPYLSPEEIKENMLKKDYIYD
jgi:acetolactate synthase I/II/III large subunit